MTTNQTIDGVPRELALRLLLGNGSEQNEARQIASRTFELALANQVESGNATD